jgi:hypothetical protein
MIVFFENKIGVKFLDVTTQTQCNLGHDAHGEHYFGRFEDDMEISFEGTSTKCKGTTLKDFSATNKKGEEGIATRKTINIISWEGKSIANQDSKGMKLLSKLGGFGMEGDVSESKTKNVVRNFLRANTQKKRV